MFYLDSVTSIVRSKMIESVIEDLRYRLSFQPTLERSQSLDHVITLHLLITKQDIGTNIRIRRWLGIGAPDGVTP